MLNIHVEDAEVLRDFARELDQFANELEAEVARVRDDVSALGEDWRDDKYNAFEAELSAELPKLSAFCEQATDFARALERKAEAVAEYYGR